MTRKAKVVEFWDYSVPDGPKALRETLCIAQSYVSKMPYTENTRKAHVARLQRLIDECDLHRPIDSDGQHRRHTSTCGCEDK